MSQQRSSGALLGLAETGVVNVVVEVAVGEEQVVYLSRKEPGFHLLAGPQSNISNSSPTLRTWELPNRSAVGVGVPPPRTNMSAIDSILPQLFFETRLRKEIFTMRSHKLGSNQ